MDGHWSHTENFRKIGSQNFKKIDIKDMSLILFEVVYTTVTPPIKQLSRIQYDAMKPGYEAFSEASPIKRTRESIQTFTQYSFNTHLTDTIFF